ncbi:tetratricopeptide repeat protein [Pseudomonadota bacterium]
MARQLLTRSKGLIGIILGLLVSTLGVADDNRSVKDLAYGPILYQFHQKNFFSAITELEAALEKGQLEHHSAEAEMLLGGLYLSYGMQRTAEGIFSRFLNADAVIGAEERNKAWLQLASIYHERGYGEKARVLLDNLGDDLTQEQSDERAVLDGLILSQQGRYAEAADRLANMGQQGMWQTYALYNLGIDQLSNGNREEGKLILDKIVRADIDYESEEALIQDRANIALGYNALNNQLFVESVGYFEGVRVSGPFINQAMLGLGWAKLGDEQFEAGLSIWLELIDRDSADPSVLEALLAVPYTLNRLGAHQQALEYYRVAIDNYGSELRSLDLIITGMDFSALIKNVANANTDPEAGWYWRADIKPGDEISPYLFQLLAGNEFQDALKQYRDLLFLDKHLERRISDLAAYGDMIDTRQSGYESRLAAIHSALSALDDNDAYQRRNQYSDAVSQIESNNDARVLANDDEEEVFERFAQADERIKHIDDGYGIDLHQKRYKISDQALSWKWEDESPFRLKRARRFLKLMDENFDEEAFEKQAQAAALIRRLGGNVNIDQQKDKLRVLKGLMAWHLETEYPKRLWDAKKRLRQLDGILADTAEQRDVLDNVLKTTPNNFEYYRERTRDARQSMIRLRQTIVRLAARYERKLGYIADNRLREFERKIKEFHSQALFAAAQVSDRAVHEQKGLP